MAKKNPLKIIGIILMVIGGVIIFLAFPTIDQSVIKIGPVEVTDVPPISATRLLIGVVCVILGLFVYHSDKLIKFLGSKKK